MALKDHFDGMVFSGALGRRNRTRFSSPAPSRKPPPQSSGKYFFSMTRAQTSKLQSPPAGTAGTIAASMICALLPRVPRARAEPAQAPIDDEGLPITLRNSRRVSGFFRNSPSMVEVTMLTPVL